MIIVTPGWGCAGTKAQIFRTSERRRPRSIAPRAAAPRLGIQWLTVMDVETNADTGAAHLSTVANGSYGTSFDALRPCIWDFMLNN